MGQNLWMGQGEKLLLVLWKFVAGAVSLVDQNLTPAVSQDGLQVIHRPREEVQRLAVVMHCVRQAVGRGGHLVAEDLNVSDAALHGAGGKLHCGPQLIQTGLFGELHAGRRATLLPGTRRSSVGMRRPQRQGRQTEASCAGVARNTETCWRRLVSDFFSTVKLFSDVVSKKKNICKNKWKNGIKERSERAAFLTNQNRTRHQRHGPVQALIPDQIGRTNSGLTALMTDRTFADWLRAREGAWPMCFC